jgi:hypothetical protein
MPYCEFFDEDYFSNNYIKKQPNTSLSLICDFFWESNFQPELQPPFSDKVFPDTGYSAVFNIGTPFRITIDGQLLYISKDIFFPRNRIVKSIHSAGNKLFGIKFHVNPFLLKNEYGKSNSPSAISPLLDLFNESLISEIKYAASFDDRVKIAEKYLSAQLNNCSNKIGIDLVTGVIKEMKKGTGISSYDAIINNIPFTGEVIHRYFTECAGWSLHNCWKNLRFRKAIKHYMKNKNANEVSELLYNGNDDFYNDVMEYTCASLQENLTVNKSLV